MDIIKAVQIAKKKLSDFHELNDWSVTTNKRKSAFGVCSYRKKEIQLSSILVPYMSIEAVNNTILHEIAHALTMGEGHNKVWKDTFVMLGGNGLRTGGAISYENGAKGKTEMLQQVSKYTLTCPVCGKCVYRQRMPKRKYSCGEHGNVFNEKYLFVIKQNY